MSDSWLPIALIGALLVGSMAALSGLRDAGRLSPEAARKSLHVGLGLTTLAFPWLFAEPTPVLALAALACLWFEGVRRSPPLARRFGSVLSAVARRGRGETHYAVGTALTFVAADGSVVSFCLPLAILALADAAAALVGRALGARPGAVCFGSKSLAGSTAFYIVALVVSVVGLILADCSLPAALGAAVVVASLTTILEGVASNGADNLLIPVTAAVLVKSTELSQEELALLASACTMLVAITTVVGARQARRADPITSLRASRCESRAPA
jgi:phytol kinase